MRSRKPAASPHPADEDRPADADDAQAHPADESDDASEVRVCLACGGSDRDAGVCPHDEMAVFRTPTANTRRAVERWRRALLEARAAERGLRSIVAAECARDRAETVIRERPKPPLPPPCPTCLARGDVPEPGAESGSTAPRKGRKRTAAQAGQSCFAFAQPAAPADEGTAAA